MASATCWRRPKTEPSGSEFNRRGQVAFYAAADIGRFAHWIDALVGSSRPFVAKPPNLARYVGEGLVLWLAFQL